MHPNRPDSTPFAHGFDNIKCYEYESLTARWAKNIGQFMDYRQGGEWYLIFEVFLGGRYSVSNDHDDEILC